MAKGSTINAHVSDSMNFRPPGSIGNAWKFRLSIIFLIIIIIESSFLYWQFGTIVHNESAKDISLVSFSILLVSNIFWLLMGVLVIGSVPICVSGGLYIVGASLIIGARIHYGDGEK